MSDMTLHGFDGGTYARTVKTLLAGTVFDVEGFDARWQRMEGERIFKSTEPDLG